MGLLGEAQAWQEERRKKAPSLLQAARAARPATDTAPPLPSAPRPLTPPKPVTPPAWAEEGFTPFPFRVPRPIVHQSPGDAQVQAGLRQLEGVESTLGKATSIGPAESWSPGQWLDYAGQQVAEAGEAALDPNRSPSGIVLGILDMVFGGPSRTIGTALEEGRLVTPTEYVSGTRQVPGQASPLWPADSNPQSAQVPGVMEAARDLFTTGPVGEGLNTYLQSPVNRATVLGLPGVFLAPEDVQAGIATGVGFGAETFVDPSEGAAVRGPGVFDDLRSYERALNAQSSPEAQAARGATDAADLAGQMGVRRGQLGRGGDPLRPVAEAEEAVRSRLPDAQDVLFRETGFAPNRNRTPEPEETFAPPPSRYPTAEEVTARNLEANARLRQSEAAERQAMEQRQRELDLQREAPAPPLVRPGQQAPSGPLEVVRQGRGPVRSPEAIEPTRQTPEPPPAETPALPPRPQEPDLAPGATVRVSNPEMAANGQQGRIVRRSGTDAPDGTPIWFVQIGKRQVAVPQTSLQMGDAPTPKPTPATPPPVPPEVPRAAAAAPDPEPTPATPEPAPVAAAAEAAPAPAARAEVAPGELPSGTPSTWTSAPVFQPAARVRVKANGMEGDILSLSPQGDNVYGVRVRYPDGSVRDDLYHASDLEATPAAPEERATSAPAPKSASPSRGGGASRPQQAAAAPAVQMESQSAAEPEQAGPVTLESTAAGTAAAPPAPPRPGTVSPAPNSPPPAAPARAAAPAPARPGGKVGKVKSQADIVRDLAKGVTRIAFGRIRGQRANRGLLGRFSPNRDIAEVRRATDYPTAYHEVGHAVQERLQPTFSQQAEASLDTLGAGGGSSWRPGMPVSRRRQEGFAEAVRQWLEDPDTLRRDHPDLAREFEESLKKDRGLERTMNRAYADMEARRRATPQELIRAERVDDPLPSNRSGILDMVEKVFDDLVHLEVASEGMARARGVKELPAGEDVHLQAKIMRGSLSQTQDTFIGHRHPVSGQAHGGQMRLVPDGDRLRREAIPGRKSLIGILDQVGDDVVREQDFVDYLVAKRAQELHGRGMQTPFDPADVDAVVADLESRHGDFDRISRELYEWQDSVLAYARDSGLLSQEAFDRIKALNDAYVPFHRIYEVGAGELPQGLKGTGGGLIVNTPGSLRRIRGSRRQIVNPIQAILQNTNALLTAAEKNRVGQTLAKAWDSDAEGVGRFLGREVEPPIELVNVRASDVMSGRRLKQELQALGIEPEDFDLTDADLRALIDLFPDRAIARPGRTPNENIVRVKDGDGWRYFQLKPEVYRAWTALDSQAAGSVAKFFGRFAAVKRAGVVQSLGFIVRNLIKDPVTAAVISDRIRLLPGETLVRGLHAFLRKPEVVQAWADAGGRFTTRTAQFSDREWARGVAEVMRGMSPTARKLTWLPASIRKAYPKLAATPFRLYEALESVSQFAEEVNRVGAFDKALSQYKKANPGANMVDLTEKAAYESRDLMDFSLRGTWTRQVKGFVPFFQPTLTGTYRFAKSMRRDPLGTTLRGFAYVATPTVMLYLANQGDQEYWQIPQEERDRFWHLRIGKGPEDFLRIPKPHLEGFVFGTMVERALQWAQKNDPKAFDEIAQEALENSLPVQFVPLDKARGGARVLPMPSSLGPIGDTMTHLAFNYDPYRRRAIDSDYQQKLPSWLRYSDYTSSTAKWMGQTGVAKAMGLSPNQIDDIFYTLGGGTGSALVRGAADPVVEKTTGTAPPTSRPRSALEHAGLQKKAGQSESEDRLRVYVTRLEQEKAGAKAEGRPFRDEGRLKMAQKALKRVNDLKRDLLTEQRPAMRESLLREIRREASRITPAVGPVRR